jgi:GrpB-like predicted nucleotidyltransferase (UPF0157 family)
MRLVPHDPSWSTWFDAEAGRIRRALHGIVLRVEHVGSTAVPGLLAKPIIDIGATVGKVGDFHRCVEPLASLGYRHRGQHGEDPLRRYFVLDEGDERLAQLHVWTVDSSSWSEALAFRDLLRMRADLRSAYASEKLRVAEEVGWRKGPYSTGKGPFIEALLESEGIRRGEVRPP